MTSILVVSTIIVIFGFGFVLLFGAPYLPTLSKQRKVALEMLNLKPGQTLFDLGCGDGRMLRMAAKQGINGIGYELNPFMYLIAKLVCFKYRNRVKIFWGNFWRADIATADGIFVFLLDKYMKQLDDFVKSRNSQKRLRLVSYVFEIPSKPPKSQKSGVFLYEY